MRGELCTPTGTALVTAFAKPVPPEWTGILRAHGYGAGTRDLPDAANVLRICLMDGPVEGPRRGALGAAERPAGRGPGCRTAKSSR